MPRPAQAVPQCRVFNYARQHGDKNPNHSRRKIIRVANCTLKLPPSLTPRLPAWVIKPFPRKPAEGPSQGPSERSTVACRAVGSTRFFGLTQVNSGKTPSPLQFLLSRPLWAEAAEAGARRHNSRLSPWHI